MTSVEVDQLAIEPAGRTEERRRAGAFGQVPFWLAVAWLGVVIALAALADVLPFVQDPYELDFERLKAGPSSAHWLGTDELGRDIFSRCVYGARLTFLVSGAGLVIGVVIGGILGLLVGFYRGVLETVVMAMTDIAFAFPGLVLILAILAFLGLSSRNVAIALGIFVIPAFVRITRANTIQFSERPFVLAARTTGARDRRIIFREILPNAAPPLASISLLTLAVLMIAEGGLSFLGLGVPPPLPTWGGMIAAGLVDLDLSPHITFIPGAVLFVTVLSLNVLGDKITSRFETKELKL